MRGLWIIALSVFLSAAVGFFLFNKEEKSAGNGQPVFERVMATKTLRCGYIAFPPYFVKELAADRYSGPVYEIVMAVAGTLGLKVEWVEEIPVGGERASLDKGGVDSICAVTGPYDGGLMTRVAYSAPYMRVENGIYVRADDPRFQAGAYTLDQLNKSDIHFTGIESDPSYVFVDLLMPEAKLSALPQLSDPSQLFLDIKAGKADAVLFEPAPAAMAMDANPGAFKRLNVTEQLPTYFAAMAFPKHETALRETFDSAIEFLAINGELDRILDGHDPMEEKFIRVSP